MIHHNMKNLWNRHSIRNVEKHWSVDLTAQSSFSWNNWNFLKDGTLIGIMLTPFCWHSQCTCLNWIKFLLQLYHILSFLSLSGFELFDKVYMIFETEVLVQAVNFPVLNLCYFIFVYFIFIYQRSFC